MAPPFHVGIVVADLEAALDELAQVAGIEFRDLGRPQVGGWTIRVAYSVDGPPHLELIEGPPGSPWDASAGARLDHLGFWVDDLAGERARLEALGMQADLALETFAYLRGPATHLRLELNTARMRAPLYELLGRHPPDPRRCRPDGSTTSC